MADRRLANRNWEPADEKGNAPSWERVNTALLMDIRDELQKLNRLLHCTNFQAIPAILRQVRKHTANLPKVKRKGQS